MSNPGFCWECGKKFFLYDPSKHKPSVKFFKDIRPPVIVVAFGHPRTVHEKCKKKVLNEQSIS